MEPLLFTNRDTKDRNNERHILRVLVKRKSDDDVSQRPLKIIRTELQNMDEENLRPIGIHSV